MKTRDLIALLQEADPSGEEHCCISNADVWTVDVEPAYYDGALHIIERDKEGHPTKGYRRRSGVKINLTSIAIRDAIEFDGFVVEYLSDDDRKRYEKHDREERRQDKHIDFDVERSFFCGWVFLQIQSIKPIPLGWVDRIKQAAEAFYLTHRGPDVDGKAIASRVWPLNSHADKLEAIWAENVTVNWDEYSRITIAVEPQP